MKKDKQAIEKSLTQRHGVTLLGKKEYRDVQIWVGEAFRNDDPDFPWGYYQGFYMLGRNDEKLDGIAEVMFDAFHDPEIPRPDRQRARKNSLIMEAEAVIDRKYETGYFA